MKEQGAHRQDIPCPRMNGYRVERRRLVGHHAMRPWQDLQRPVLIGHVIQMQAQASESGGDVTFRIHIEDLGTGEKRDFASVVELGHYLERWSGRSDSSRFAPPSTGRA